MRRSGGKTDGVPPRRLVNLTPHVLRLETDQGMIEIPPASRPARADMTVEDVGTVDIGTATIGVVRERRGSVIGLPAPTEGTVFVVARIVAESEPDRTDLCVPTELVRDASGAVIAARRLAVLAPVAPSPTDPQTESTLVVLCGSQPLPAYLAATTRQPSRVVLVHTDQTKATAERVAALLAASRSAVSTELLRVGDASRGAVVRRSLERLGSGWGLDYTGGTKVMAAHARLVLASTSHDSDRRATYVDHAADRLRWDDGRDQRLRTAGLTLERITSLHGGRLRSVQVRHRPDPQWLRSFARKLLRDLERASGYGAKRAAVETHLGRLRSLRSSEPWAQELRNMPGLWLEWLVEDRLLVVLDGLPRREVELTVGARLTPPNARDVAELDVLLRVGWKVRLLSCDTSQPARRWSAEHKKKAIEAQARARQVGGDAARAGLVTLLDPMGVEAIRSHLAPGEISVPPTVFGRHDLSAWLADDLSSLTGWCLQ